jgi:DNA repair protein RecO (recombination protein O)
MTTQRRVQQQPAFILHHRPFRDTSQILDVLSRDHGKLALVARGSRGSRSRLKGILRPFMPLDISWVQRTDLGTLTGAEVRGAPLSLTGDALLCGYYVNELLIHFLHRHDPQPEIFELYGRTLTALGAADDVAVCLRQFELELLRQVGYALNLGHDAVTHEALDESRHYEYRMEQGPVGVGRSDGPLVFPGAVLAAIDGGDFERPEVLRAANRLLREVIDFHLGGKVLKTRKVLMDIRRL